MDDVIAVEITLETGEKRFYLTWGRVQETVDPGPVAEIVLAGAVLDASGAKPIAARVCDTLQEARDAPYFYECYFDMCRTVWPDDWHAWRAQTDEQMRAGRQLWYLGAPENFANEGPHASIPGAAET